MAKSYGGISVDITGNYDNKDIKKAIADLKALEDKSKETEGAFKSFSDLSGKAKLAIAGFAAAGAAAVVSFAKDSLMAASDFDEVQNKVQQVFGPDGRKDLNNWAEDANTAFGLSKTAALDAAAQFGIFGSAAGLAGDDLQGFTKDLVQLGGDLASFNNTSVDDALQALGAGLRGEAEGLRRFGVLLDDATLKAKAAELGIYSGNAALTQQQKILAAQASILAQTSAQQGDFARTSDGLANTMRVVEASVENAKIEIGEGLLKAVNAASRAFGGANGFADLIEDTSSAVADATYGIGVLIEAMFDLRDATEDGAEANKEWYASLFDFVKDRAAMNNFFSVLFTALQAVGVQARETEERTDNLNTAWSDYRRAQQGVVKITPEVVDALNATTNAAGRTAVSAEAAARALLETSIATGQVPSAARYAMRFDVAEMLANIGKESTKAASGISSVADTTKIKWAEIAAGVTEASVIITGKSKEVSESMYSALQERAGAFKTIINEQVSLIQQAQQSLDSYADSVTDAILGKIDFSTSDAQGNPLTPEQIVQTVLGDIANQTNAVKAIAEAGIITQLPQALAEKLLTLPPDAAVALANYLAANPAMVAQLDTNYKALATLTETLLGVPMAETFAMIGDESALEMITKAKEKIRTEAAAFKNYVKDKLSTTITVSVRYVAVNSVPGVGGGEISVKVPGNANGGFVGAGMPTLVGERGPEIIVPTVGSTIIRGERTRNMMNSGGGGINLTVNAGMGTDGAEVGRQIVDALKAYQRRNGPIPVSVA